MSVVTANIKNIKTNQPLKAKYELMSIDINWEVNRIPFAQLVLLDGDAATRKFPLSDAGFFKPGEGIEIQLRYENADAGPPAVFQGLVLRHSLESDGVDSILRVELRDPAYCMTMARNSAVHKGTDTAIIKKLIANNKVTSGDLVLKAGKIAATKPSHPEIIQYYATDWDFMLSRAQVQNLLVVVQDGTVTLASPLKIKGRATHKFEYGISPMYGFELEADAGSQFEAVESVAWDKKKNTPSKVQKAAEFALPQNNLSGSKIAKAIGSKKLRLNSPVAIDAKEAQKWADGHLARARMSLLRGSISVPGLAKVQLLDVMELKGMGAHFKGKTLVTGIRHQVDDNGWQTHLQFGLPAEPFSRSPDILDAPAAGLLPAVHGLQPGIVQEFDKKDPDKQFRVRIKLPGVDPEKGMVWARMAMPEAGDQRGHLFLPEPGDEVVVGFFNDDPRQPVILGALYSSTNKPPAGWQDWTKDNTKKNRGIVSNKKDGVKISIDDKDKVLTLMTPKKQSIIINDKDEILSVTDAKKQSIVFNNKQKIIEIKDANNNKITLNDKGITINVASKLVIDAKGDVEIKGKNIKLNASAKVEIKGSAVDIK